MNMEENPKEFNKDIKKLRLSGAEKSEMRTDFSAFLDKNPLPIQSPFRYHRFTFIKSAGLTLIVFFMITGVVSAAEDSLPDEFLYPVKTNINEPVLEALSFTSERKAKVHLSLVEKRLLEAEELLIKDRGTVEIMKKLQEDVKEHAEEVNKNLEDIQLSDEEDKMVKAESVNSDFEAVLNIHSDILEQVANDESEESIMKPITNEVKMQNINTGSRGDALQSALFSSNVTVEKINHTTKVIRKKIKEIEKNISVEIGNQDKDINEELVNIQLAKDLIVKSNLRLKDGSPRESLVLLERADQILEETSVAVIAQKELDINIDSSEDSISTTTSDIGI
jgi:hypothetical protein